jgi:DedD protein
MQFLRERDGELFMEKKKLLLVAVSVGMFLVIAIGAAIVILSKQNADPSVIARGPYQPGMSETITPNISSEEHSARISSVADIPNAEIDSGITTPLDNLANTTEPASVDPASLLHNPEINIVKAAPKETMPTSINHSYGDTNNVADVRVERYTPEGIAKAAETPKVVSAPVSKPRTPAALPQTTQVTRAPAQAPKSVPAKVYNDYWVQTGSFAAKIRADNVKESLGSKGISSVIEVRNVNDKTMYRVRVGPYTSQNEAEYWLSLIQTIDGFEQSQIWQSQSVR